MKTIHFFLIPSAVTAACIHLWEPNSSTAPVQIPPLPILWFSSDSRCSSRSCCYTHHCYSSRCYRSYISSDSCCFSSASSCCYSSAATVAVTFHMFLQQCHLSRYSNDVIHSYIFMILHQWHLPSSSSHSPIFLVPVVTVIAATVLVTIFWSSSCNSYIPIT